MMYFYNVEQCESWEEYVGTQDKSCRGDEERQLGGVEMYEWSYLESWTEWGE